MSRQLTPSQTVGPFFKHAFIGKGFETMVVPQTRGERIVIEGRILDGDGTPVNDAMIELWQANAQGRYDHPEDTQEKLLDPNFHGFGRAATDGEGWFRLTTIKPGSVPSDDVLQAPHINMSVFARGLLDRLVTRVYFPDEPLNAADPVLNSVPAARRVTLIARRSAGSKDVFRFDVILQGRGETVFFDF